MTDPWASVATYAALEAQLASTSANRAKVLADAKLDGLALARLRAAWDVRFAGDRLLEEAYEDALEAQARAPIPAPALERRAVVIEEPPRFAAPRAPSPEASRWAAQAPPAPQDDAWAVVPPGMRHFSGLGETGLASNLPAGPALPFTPSAGGEAPSVARSVEEQRPPGLARTPHHLSGTALAVEAPRGPALPFERSAVATSHSSGPPALTVDQYALLRAHLAVNGEGDKASWAQFGITEAADKLAVQAGFAARFKQDPAMQARFVELVPRLTAQLRRGSGQ